MFDVEFLREHLKLFAVLSLIGRTREPDANRSLCCGQCLQYEGLTLQRCQPARVEEIILSLRTIELLGSSWRVIGRDGANATIAPEATGHVLRDRKDGLGLRDETLIQTPDGLTDLRAVRIVMKVTKRVIPQLI